MKALGILLVLISTGLLISCGEEPVHEDVTLDVNTIGYVSDSVIVLPDAPMEVALKFTNMLGMNDPSCFDLLSAGFSDSLPLDSLSPQQIFGRWRAFDASGRLTSIQESPGEIRTSYYCTIRRMENPAINRIDFLLTDDRWLIDGFGIELPPEKEDSLTIEQLADLVLQHPDVRAELRVVRMLYDDCLIDSIQSYASLNAAVQSGTDFQDFILDLQPESYALLVSSNIRRAGKMQIIKDRAETRFIDIPADLAILVNIWREMSYISKSVLRTHHEAIQNLYSTGIWIEPNITLEIERLAGFQNFFLSVSNIVEARDSLSRTYRVVLTSGSNEPLAQAIIDLDPHQLEQKLENEVGLTIWRALAVEMNGDNDPERVIYWAGNLFLFQGIPSGYRLVWRTYENYDSDYHPEFVSQPSGKSGCREITFTGNDGRYTYFLGYNESGEPLFRRISSVDDTVELEE